jgi:hypothetical protein
MSDPSRWMVRDYAASGMHDKPRRLHLSDCPHFTDVDDVRCADCERKEQR